MEIDEKNMGDAGEAENDKISSFSGKKFCKHLRNVDDQIIKYVRMFVNKSKDRRNEDIVQEFLTKLSSSSIHDSSTQLTQLLKDGRPNDEIVAVFNCLEIILLRISDDLRTYEPWAIEVVNQLMGKGMVHIFSSGLNGTDGNRKIATLCLLTSMVTSSHKAASKVSNSFPWDRKTLCQLLTSSKQNVLENVRTCTIHFLVSFLMTENADLICNILFKKGFCNIFNMLHKDKMSTIEILLRTLLSQVVKNPSISKLTKIHFFNCSVLTGILKLFQWKEVTLKNKNEDEDAALERAERTDSVRQMAYEFVYTLFCSPNQDTNIGFGNNSRAFIKSTNPVLTKLLLHHDAPYDDPLLEDLFVSICKAVPNQIAICLSRLRQRFVVQATDRFVRIMSYVRKIIAAQNPIEVLGSTKGERVTTKLVNNVMQIVTISLLKKKVLVKILQHKNVVVRHQGVLFIGTVLEKASCLVNENDTQLKSLFFGPDKLSNFVTEFKQKLLASLPPLHLLFTCLNLAISCDDLPETEVVPEDESLKTVVEDLDHICAIVTAVKTYVCIGGSFTQEMLNSVSEKLLLVLTRDCDTEVTMMILELISDSHLGKTLLIQMVLDKSVAKFICEAIGGGSGSQSTAKKLLKTLLLRTGHFDEVRCEVAIWIDQFSEWSTTPEIVDFFASVVVHLVRDVDTLMDFQKDLCLKAVGSSAKKENKVYDKLFDEILLEDDDNDVQEDLLSHGSIVERMPFSLMVFAALHLLDGSESADLRGKFLSSVLSDVIHVQQDGPIMCYVLKQHEKILSKRFVKYLRSLDPSVSEEEPKTPSKKPKMMDVVDRKSITAFLKQTFQHRWLPESEFEVSEDVWKQLSDEDVTLVVHQVLVYLKVLTSGRSSHELVTFYCNFLLEIVERDRSSSNTVLSVGNLILSHSVTRENSLHENLLVNSAENVSLEKITQLVFKIISVLTDLNPFPHLVDRCVDFVLAKLRRLKENGSTSEKETSLVHILDPLKGLLSVEALRRLVECLSEFAPIDMLTENMDGLSSAGRLLAFILMVATTLHSDQSQQILTLKQFSDVAELYKDVSALIPQDRIEDVAMELSVLGSELADLLDSSPLYGHVISDGFFDYCLASRFAFDQKLADVILRSNVSYFVRLEEWLLKGDFLLTEPNTYAKIVLTYLRFQRNSCASQALRSEATDRFLAIIMESYWPMIVGCVLGEKDVVMKDDVLDKNTAFNMFKSIIYSQPPILSSEQRLQFYRRAENHLKTGGVLTKQALMDLRVVIASIPEEEGGDILIIGYVMICLRCLLSVRKDVQIHDGNIFRFAVNGASNMLEKNKYLPGLMEELKKSKIWKPFLKMMQFRYLFDSTKTVMLVLLTNMLKTLHKTEELKLSRVSKVFGMIYEHKEFIGCLLNTSPMKLEWKSKLFNLLLFLVEADPSICRSEHIPVYLASYEPILRQTNETILQLLRLYELNGVTMKTFHPIVWGQMAIKRYSVGSTEEPAFRSRIHWDVIFSHLNKDNMYTTALNFPIDLKLNSEHDNQYPMKYNENFYDPRFLLPLLANLLSTENPKMSSSFIRSNSLPLAFASLSSNDYNMRAAGYFVLNRIYRLMNKSQFLGRHIWIYLLDIVRNALTSPGTRLSSIITVFLVNVCGVIDKPTGAASIPIINFIFTKPILDINNIPDFYVMFSNSDVRIHQHLRMTILDIMEKGLRTPVDYHICGSRHVLQIILGYYESQLASQQCKIQILRVLKSATRIDTVAVNMCKRYGILAFLDTVVRNCNDDQEIIAEVVSILHSFCFVEEEQREHNCDTMIKKTKKKSRKMYSILFIEFQLVLTSLLDHLSGTLSLDTFEMYLTMLASVYGFNNEEQFFVPRITTVSLKTLLNIYGRIIGDRHPSYGKYTFMSVSSSIKAIYRIVMSWRCCHTTSDLQHSNLYVEVLATAVKRLLQDIQLHVSSHGKLFRVFTWLREHLENDTSGAVTRCLLESSDSDKEIVLPLITASTYLMKSMTSAAVSFIYKSSVIEPLLVLAQLDLVFVAIGRNLHKSYDLLDFGRFLSTFAWKKFCDLLQRPDVCEFIDAVKGDEITGISAVSLALLMCESLLQNGNSEISKSFIENMVMEGKKFAKKKIVVESEGTSSVKRKKDQTEKRTSKKLRELP